MSQALDLDTQVIVTDDGSDRRHARELLADSPKRRQPSRAPPSRTAGKAPRSGHAIARVEGRHRRHPGRRPRVRPRRCPGADRADRAGRGGCRLRHPPRRGAGRSARPLFWHLVGNRVLSLLVSLLLQHHAQRHRDGLQGVSDGRPTLARPSEGRFRHRGRDHREGLPAGTCESTRSRSRITVGPTPRARRSPGATASRRSRCCWCLRMLGRPSVVSPASAAASARSKGKRRRCEEHDRGGDTLSRAVEMEVDLQAPDPVDAEIGSEGRGR